MGTQTSVSSALTNTSGGASLITLTFGPAAADAASGSTPDRLAMGDPKLGCGRLIACAPAFNLVLPPLLLLLLLLLVCWAEPTPDPPTAAFLTLLPESAGRRWTLPFVVAGRVEEQDEGGGETWAADSERSPLISRNSANAMKS